MNEEKQKHITIRIILTYLFMVLIVWFICFYEFPYYIDKPGGLDNINNKVKIEGGYDTQGSINLTYVGELKGTIPFLIIAYFHPDWTINSKESSNIGTLNYETDMIRQKILMKQSYTTAIKYAYEKAHKDISIKQEKCYIIYVFEEGKNDLKVGDQILELDGVKINNHDEFKKLVTSKKAGDKSELLVLNNGKKYKRHVEYYLEDDVPVMGVQLGIESILEANPKFELKYDSLEYGPSGGLMISLAVYNSLVKEDITGGMKIAGTGTLDENGNVGAVGGIDYKLKGAVKGGAKVFFAPSEENYDEAMKLKKEKGYKIPIVRVEKFEDALDYLEHNIIEK